MFEVLPRLVPVPYFQFVSDLGEPHVGQLPRPLVPPLPIVIIEVHEIVMEIDLHALLDVEQAELAKPLGNSLLHYLLLISILIHLLVICSFVDVLFL